MRTAVPTHWQRAGDWRRETGGRVVGLKSSGGGLYAALNHEEREEREVREADEDRFFFAVFASFAAFVVTRRERSPSEKRHQFGGQRGSEIIDARDAGRVLVEARDVVADADCGELHRRALLDVIDNLSQVGVKVI